jgi:hypothetical protein
MARHVEAIFGQPVNHVWRNAFIGVETSRGHGNVARGLSSQTSEMLPGDKALGRAVQADEQ